MNTYILPALHITHLPEAADPLWQQIPTLEINAFRPESSDHRPITQARLFHNQNSLCALFSVQDCYVRCTHNTYGSRTYQDSCVELFLQPVAGKGYFAFEINCGGTQTALYITDPTRLADGYFKEYHKLSQAEASQIAIRASLPDIIEPEIQSPLYWTLSLQIPVQVLENYVGKIGPLSGQRWRANVYKCGDETSHPHWVSWSPVPELNFHLPQAFGAFVFA